MDQTVITSPIVHCIIVGENQTVFMMRESIELSDERGVFKVSHWDLPKGKLKRGESVLSAAERIVYRKTGLGLLETRELRSNTGHWGNHHRFVLVSETSGEFTRNEYIKGKEGMFQWIEYPHLTCYAIRRSTMAIIKDAFS